jgi:carbamoyltransferase
LIEGGKAGQVHILGINLSHDRSACLLKDGIIVTAIAEERLDGMKKSSLSGPVRKKGLNGRIPPLRAISYCLEAGDIGIDDLALIVADNAMEPVNITSLQAVLPVRDKSKVRALPHPSHHLAHAYSAYFCSSFSESAVLVADVFGSATDIGTEAESGFHAQGEHIEPVFKNLQKLWSGDGPEAQTYFGLTYIYNFISLALGFTIRGDRPKDGEIVAEAGKTMGLASYGRPVEEWPPIITVRGDKLDTSGFRQWALDRKIAKIQGGVLVPAARSNKARITRNHMNLAYVAQAELEKGMIFLADRLHVVTGSKNLCIAGGAGLNSIINKKILDETPFENVFIQPASTDDGTAVGCALYGWHALAGQKARAPLRHVYLGRPCSEDEIQKSLRRHRLPEIAMAKSDLLRESAGHLADGKIVGWYQGGSEFGPRALGHRSILADSRRLDMKDLVNQRVKHRESFRPYAPSVLLENAAEYFDLSCASPYMLLVAEATRAKASEIPAVLHVDGTARLQTLTAEDNDLFYDLVREFYRLTGVPVVLNTSFNIMGMPIVETPDDAIGVFLDSEMDALALGQHLIVKDDQETMAALAHRHQAGEQFDKAAEVSRHALEQYPDDGRFWGHLAGEHHKRGDYSQAIEAAETALRLGAGEDGPRMHLVLGESRLKVGDFAQAIPELEAARAAAPDDERISLALARCHRELGQVQRMQEELDQGFRQLSRRLRGF